MTNKYNLIVSCPDRTGIVAAVSSFIADRSGLILEADHHSDLENNWFFMRYEIDADTLEVSLDDFKNQFHPLADQYKMSYRIRAANDKQNILIMASLESHCLEELLYRWQSCDINANVVGVISNHTTLKERTEWYKLPFFHIPVDKNNKEPHFTKIQNVIKDNNVDTIVLARYMQILPDNLCKTYSGRIINIHHSFLPSFVGAKPYTQAYHRGVKLIGATSHYVTDELDEGPIIEQDVIRISHRQDLKTYIRMGKDVERMVLARALKAHLEDRVIIHGNKTIVFT